MRTLLLLRRQFAPGPALCVGLSLQKDGLFHGKSQRKMDGLGRYNIILIIIIVIMITIIILLSL